LSTTIGGAAYCGSDGALDCGAALAAIGRRCCASEAAWVGRARVGRGGDGACVERLGLGGGVHVVRLRDRRERGGIGRQRAHEIAGAGVAALEQGGERVGDGDAECRDGKGRQYGAWRAIGDAQTEGQDVGAAREALVRHRARHVERGHDVGAKQHLNQAKQILFGAAKRRVARADHGARRRPVHGGSQRHRNADNRLAFDRVHNHAPRQHVAGPQRQRRHFGVAQRFQLRRQRTARAARSAQLFQRFECPFVRIVVVVGVLELHRRKQFHQQRRLVDRSHQFLKWDIALSVGPFWNLTNTYLSGST
jgi:hypothetical protein